MANPFAITNQMRTGKHLFCYAQHRAKKTLSPFFPPNLCLKGFYKLSRIPNHARHNSERGTGSDLLLKNQAGFKKVYGDLTEKRHNNSRFFIVEPESRTVHISPAGTDFREIREGCFHHNKDRNFCYDKNHTATAPNTDLCSQIYGDSAAQKHINLAKKTTDSSSSFYLKPSSQPKGFVTLETAIVGTVFLFFIMAFITVGTHLFHVYTFYTYPLTTSNHISHLQRTPRPGKIIHKRQKKAADITYSLFLFNKPIKYKRYVRFD
jgi:hypothetical protein